MKDNIEEKIEVPSGVTATVADAFVTLKGPAGEIKREFKHPKVALSLEGSTLILKVQKATKREKAVIYAYASHLKNMVAGVQEPFMYKVKICSGHFPMNVAVSGNELQVKNFLGESVPRKVSFSPEVKVKINGVEIEITSPDKELAGQTAAKFEQLCRITNRDRRIFQDGLYIIQKAGKDL